MSFCKIQYIGNEVLEMAKLRDKIVGYISPKQRKINTISSLPARRFSHLRWEMNCVPYVKLHRVQYLNKYYK